MTPASDPCSHKRALLMKVGSPFSTRVLRCANKTLVSPAHLLVATERDPHAAADVTGRADILTATSPCPWPLDLLLHPRSLLPVQPLQAASARSNYYVSAPVKGILFVSVTLSSSSELGRSSNVGLISVNQDELVRKDLFEASSHQLSRQLVTIKPSDEFMSAFITSWCNITIYSYQSLFPTAGNEQAHSKKMKEVEMQWAVSHNALKSLFGINILFNLSLLQMFS